MELLFYRVFGLEDGITIYKFITIVFGQYTSFFSA